MKQPPLHRTSSNAGSIPHIIDQFIWGGKVEQLGVGPQPIPHPKLKAENMAEVLRVLQSPEMRRKAADLGAAIHAEPDGVAEAVRLMKKLIGAEPK